MARGFGTVYETIEKVRVSGADAVDALLGTGIGIESIAVQIRTGSRDIRLLALRKLEDQLRRGDVHPSDGPSGSSEGHGHAGN